MPKAKKIILGAILGAIFLPLAATASESVQNFGFDSNSYSSRNEYVNKTAFGHIATSTHTISSLTFITLGTGATSETIYITAVSGLGFATNGGVTVATSSSVTVTSSAGGSATTTVNFTPAIQRYPGNEMTFVFHSEDTTNHTVVFTQYNSSSFPAYVFNYLGSGIWENGSVVGAAYAASWFSTTGETATTSFCASGNPNCLASQPPVSPECEFFTDFGGCIAQSFAFLFIPTPEIANSLFDITLASSTPFNYLYELNGYFITLRDGTATSTIISTPFMGSTIVLFNSANIAAVVGTSWANLFVIVRTLISYMIWFAVLLITWKEVQRVLHPHQK